jgi:hypothetical protein
MIGNSAAGGPDRDPAHFLARFPRKLVSSSKASWASAESASRCRDTSFAKALIAYFAAVTVVVADDGKGVVKACDVV